jgi:hypothetical protein
MQSKQAPNHSGFGPATKRAIETIPATLTEYHWPGIVSSKI